MIMLSSTSQFLQSLWKMKYFKTGQVIFEFKKGQLFRQSVQNQMRSHMACVGVYRVCARIHTPSIHTNTTSFFSPFPLQTSLQASRRFSSRVSVPGLRRSTSSPFLHIYLPRSRLTLHRVQWGLQNACTQVKCLFALKKKCCIGLWHSRHHLLGGGGGGGVSPNGLL